MANDTAAPAATFAIGIDLGTTNTALGAVRLDDDAAVAAPFPLPQLVAAGEVFSKALLPSFLYLPADAELAEGALALPWDKARSFSVGQLAKDKAATVPGRVVSSAKSWLVHPGVDRRAGILPFGATADDDVTRVSPV